MITSKPLTEVVPALFFLFMVFCCGFYVSLHGLKHLENNRVLLGSMLLTIGIIDFFFCIYLFSSLK